MVTVAKRLDGLRCHLVWRLDDFVFDGDPASLRKKGTPTPTHFLAHVYCGPTAAWIKMPLGAAVNVGPGDVVLDGVATPQFAVHV